MNEKKLGVILEALANQIEELNTKIYILEHENEGLKKENERLRDIEKFFMDQLQRKEVDDEPF